MQKSKRPPDTNFAQQRLITRPANFTTVHLAVLILLIGIIFLPVGTHLRSVSDNVYEKSITYDSGSGSTCYISESNQGRTCQVTFSIDKDFDGPVFLYYQLQNFWQNHRRYYQSRSIDQLQGQVLSENDVSLDCNPLYMNNTLLLSPCGLIANSYFNDVFSVNTASSSPANTWSLDESDIALPSDKNTLYKQVKGFQSAPVASPLVPCTTVGLPSDCKSYYDSATDQDYLFYYPNDDSTQYLYESYPNQISPLDGVTDQHFIVWMRVEALPTFRKLYGKIDGNFNSGDTIVVNITANYEVDSFDGVKSLVISNLGSLGGKNPFPGQVFMTLGSFSVIFGVFLLAKEFVF